MPADEHSKYGRLKEALYGQSDVNFSLLEETLSDDDEGFDTLPMLMAAALTKREHMGEVLAMMLSGLLYNGKLQQYANDFLAFKLEELAQDPKAAANFFAMKNAKPLDEKSPARDNEKRMLDLVNAGYSARKSSAIVEAETGAKAGTPRQAHKRAIHRHKVQMALEELVRNARAIGAAMYFSDQEKKNPRK